jgi:uncharacterized protein
MKTGTTRLPLHGGKAPSWLFRRMTLLAREITSAIVIDYGPEEMLRRLSDPYWFQAFGCVLGFDWHSSGLTTTVGGALKEGLRGLEREFGLYVCGGKGATSRKTPLEIREASEKAGFDPEPLVYASRMAAKVDSAAVQDGYQLYHHNFIFLENGKWCVVQQGMNEDNRYARRYHWLGEGVSDFVCEPHAAVCAEKTERVLNLVAEESASARVASALAARMRPEALVREMDAIRTLELPRRHAIVEAEDISSTQMHKILERTYEAQPKDFETLLGLEGVGPKTIRALALIGEVIHGAKPSFRDPARFSFAHGGKDGIPYPVDRAVYDRSIAVLQRGVEKAKLGTTDRLKALKALSGFYT